MSNPRFIVCSGYHANPKSGLDWFFHLWKRHNFKFVEPIIIGDYDAPYDKLVKVSGDLGGCGELLTGRKAAFVSACPAAWMIAAWMAYASESDLVFVEQDVLCFGPWIDQLYIDIGAKKALFGTSRVHGCATSLFLLKHSYIPTWCADYLAEGPENVPGRIPELKVKRMAERKPEDYAQLSFGFDSDRPMDFNLPVWYAQKLTPSELRAMRELGLVSFGSCPDVRVFSNH